MCPCKGCEVRSENCHAGCEDYKKFRKDMEKKAEARNKARQIDMYMRDHRGLQFQSLFLWIFRSYNESN